MVWPIYPIVVCDKVKATAVAVAVTFYLLPKTCDISGWWAFLLAPILVGMYLRFLFTAPEDAVDDSGGDSSKKLYCTRSQYYAKKERVAKEAQAIVDSGNKIRMYKKTASNTFRLTQVDDRTNRQGKIDLSDFNRVLGPEITETSKGDIYVDLEASTTFETFVDALLPLGYMPLVVPELRTITVGGAIVGIGLESSCFRNGFVHDGLLEADILLGTGEVVTVKPDCPKYGDLFRGIPNSLGSFGYILRLRMRIQETKPLVRFTKTWHDSPEKLIQAIEDACKPEAKNDFVDAMALSTTGGMLFEGKLCENDDKYRISDYSWSSGKQFYRGLIDEGQEYLTIRDYIWRWDADWFWCTQIFPGLGIPLIRWLCGPKLLRSDKYKVFNDKMESVIPKFINGDLELVIQDIEVPVEKSAEWIRTHCKVVPSEKLGKIKLTRKENTSGRATVPIWLCPMKATPAPLMPMDQSKFYINFGFWDALEDRVLTKGGNDTGLINRALEKACDPVGAKKTLYSTCFYSEQEFYDRYNGKEYMRLKEQFDPKGALRGWYQRLSGH